MTALIMFPLAFGLGAVGPTVVDALFDRKWLPLVRPLGACLAMVAAIYLAGAALVFRAAAADLIAMVRRR